MDSEGEVWRRFLDHASEPYVGMAADGRIIHWNPKARQLFGWEASEVVGRELAEVLVPESLREAHRAGLRRFLEVGDGPVIGRPIELPALRRDGAEVIVELSVSVLPPVEGEALFGAFLRDTTLSRRVETQLRQTVEELNAAQELAQIGIWSIDLATTAVTFSDKLREILGLSPDADVANLPEAIGEYISPADQLRVVEILAAAPTMAEPFTIEVDLLRGDTPRRVHVFGTISRDEAGTPLRIWGTAQDVTEQRMAEAALRQAAMDLAHERETVERLQRAFLPALPTHPGVELAATYRPAGDEAVVGGDWYDVFTGPDGSLGFVMGDVAGHGVRAAALMAQLRNAARALAVEGYGPAATMNSLGRFMEQFEPTGYATAIVGQFDAGARRLTWSASGHPPLILHGAGGSQIHDRADGPPLGAIPGSEYRQRQVTLGEGDLIVLYTDGLIERRDESIDVGLGRLGQSVGELAATPGLDDLCHALCDRLLAGSHQLDDVCVLAIRCTDAGGPR